MSQPRLQSADKSDICTYPSCSAPASANFRCPTCNFVSYCNIVHSLFDIWRHTRECPGYRPLRPQLAVEVRKVDFLFFPVDATTPYIDQVDCLILRGSSGQRDADWYQRCGSHIPGFTIRPVGPISSSAPSSRLFLAFDDFCPLDGPPLPPNLCVQHLTGGRSRLPWAGTLVGCRIREPGEYVMEFLDISMADLPQFVTFLKGHHAPIPGSPSIHNVTPDESLATLTRQASRDRLQADYDFSSTAAESVVRDRLVSPRYPTVPSPRTSEEELKKAVRVEVREAIWETGITIVGVLLGAFGLWRFVLSPFISFFLAVFTFFLRAPLALMKLFLWPLTLLKFVLT